MRDIHRFETVDSTMIRAAALAGAGCASGTVVVADEQTAGQGRQGHGWHSEKYSGLYMSEVLRLDIGSDTLPVVTLAIGLATAEAIAKTAGVACDLRWPNDILVNGKKCAGILVNIVGQAVSPAGNVSSGQGSGALIIGIGINVNHTHFPPDISSTATSLRIATGREHAREPLLYELIRSIDEHIDTLRSLGKDAVLRAFARSSTYVRGRRVVVDQPGGVIEGTTDGLDPQGFLLVKRDDGRRELIIAGGVRPACS